jgi:DNA-binding PadR family transcriptional regulator
MARARRPSAQTLKVLSALAARPSEWRYGYELSREIVLQPGSLYPILVRLSDRDLLESRWETDLTQGRPPRHLYRLTGRGLEYARAQAPTAIAPARPRRRAELRGAR